MYYIVPIVGEGADENSPIIEIRKSMCEAEVVQGQGGHRVHPSPDLQAWLQCVCSDAWLVGAQRTELWTHCGNNELIENIWTEVFLPLSQSGLVSKPSGSTETHAC